MSDPEGIVNYTGYASIWRSREGELSGQTTLVRVRRCQMCGQVSDARDGDMKIVQVGRVGNVINCGPCVRRARENGH